MQSTEQGSAPRDWYPWIATMVAFFGTFLAIVNTTTVNVLLPVIGDDLRVSTGLEWIVTSYLVAVGVTQPATGWVVDRFGRRWSYATGLAVFAAGSVLVGIAPSLPLLIACRLVQGLGAGMILPVGLAIVVEAFPADRRGTAMGIWGIALMVAPAVGPLVGGWLATSVDWRALFLLNAPFGVVGAVLARRLLRDGRRDSARSLDVTGLALVAVGVSLLLLTLSGARGAFGLRDVTQFAVAISCLAVFVRRQLKRPDPLVEVRMFAVPAFRRALLLGWLLMLAQHSRLFLVPIELQAIRDASPLDAGLLMAPAAVGTALLMPVGGRLTDRVGPRAPIIGGMVLMAGGVWSLGHLSPDSSLTAVVWWQVLQGAGAGLCLLPATLASLNAVPTRLVPQASALRAVNQQLAAAVAVTVLAAVVMSSIGSLTPSDVAPAGMQVAYNRAFLVVFVGLVAALPLAARLPGRVENRLVQQARQAEVDSEQKFQGVHA